MTRKTISVIIPNYNHAHFLRNAIQSYLLQTHQPSEIIVVDDGSQDDSLAIIEEISKTTSLIKLIRLVTNVGVNKAIMKGLSEAQGDYVVFTAADDFVDKSFLEKSLNTLKQYPQAGFSFCDPSEFIYESKTSHYYPLHLSDKPIYLSPNHLYAILKSYSFTFPSNAAVFNRNFLIRAGGFIENLDLGADWFACFVCAFRHGVCYIPEPLTFATVRKDSFSAQGLGDSSRQKETFFRIFDLLYSNFSDVREYFKNSGIVYEYSLRSLFWLLSSRKYYDYLSFPLIKRITVRGIGRYLRPSMSPHQRRRIREWIVKYKITI